jgi:hypothetical protein
VFSEKGYPMSMGFSDDEMDQMMKMVFGDDATYNDTGATVTGATNATSSAGNRSDGAWNNIAGTDIYGNAPSLDLGVNYLTQSPPANPALTLGNQMPGANQPDGSWYQPFRHLSSTRRARSRGGFLPLHHRRSLQPSHRVRVDFPSTHQ